MVVVQVPPTAYALCGNRFRDLRQPPRHRADAVSGKASRDGLASNRRRWPGRHTVTDKWRRYFVSSVTPSWFWFSVFWQALWAIVRLMIANIVGKFAQLLQTIGRQRMSEVEQQGRRAVLVYY